MNRHDTWMIGDIDVNSIIIDSFDDLLRYLFVVFCVKKDIKIEFSLWTSSNTNEGGFFVSFDDNANAIIERFFVTTQFLDVAIENNYRSSDEMFKYQDFYETLVGLPIESFIEICPRLFDRLCEVYYHKSRDIGPLQPFGITKFVCSLLKENDCKSIYNPFSGLCSYSICMEQDVLYRGQEKNFETFQIAQLRLDAYNKANSIVYQEDATTKLEGRFDAVVATPPFLIQHISFNDERIKLDYSELFLLRSLDSDAKIYVGIVPARFIFDEQHRQLRKDLSDKRIVEAIINLPSGVFPHTNFQAAIVILRPQGGCNNVAFLDAEDCFDSEQHELNSEKLLRLLHESKQNSNECASFKDIEAMDYDFSTVGYQLLCVDEATKVKDVVKIGQSARREEGEHSIYSEGNTVVRRNVLDDSDFSDNLLRLYSLRDVSQEIETTVDYNKITGPHLVVTKRKNELVCYYHKGNTSFYVAPYHLVLKVDETKLNPYLLAYYLLYHPVVKSYALRLFNGNMKDVTVFRSQEILEKLNSSVRLRLSGKEFNKFFNLKLGLEDIKSQGRFIDSFIRQQRRLREQEIQAERERWGIRETTSDIVHMLGRPFSKQQNIIGFLKSHKPVDAGYEDAVVALADISNFIRRLVTSVGGDFSNYDYRKEDVALSSFVQEYVRSWNNFAVKDFELVVEDNVGANTIISMDKDTMMILFDAAMDNAWRHGFKKQRKDGNKVCVSMFAVDLDGKLYVDIQIGNNGAIIEPGLSNEVFISKGRFSKDTGRTGLGGNHIYQIAKKHDGFLSVRGGGRWSFCIDVLLPIKEHDENISTEYISSKLFFV